MATTELKLLIESTEIGLLCKRKEGYVEINLHFFLYVISNTITFSHSPKETQSTRNPTYVYCALVSSCC